MKFKVSLIRSHLSLRQLFSVIINLFTSRLFCKLIWECHIMILIGMLLLIGFRCVNSGDLMSGFKLKSESSVWWLNWDLNCELSRNLYTWKQESFRVYSLLSLIFTDDNKLRKIIFKIFFTKIFKFFSIKFKKKF